MTEKKTDNPDWAWISLFILIVVQWFVTLFFILPNYAWEWQTDSNKRRIEHLEERQNEHYGRLSDLEWKTR